jgi:hypothetical protein
VVKVELPLLSPVEELISPEDEPKLESKEKAEEMEKSETLSDRYIYFCTLTTPHPLFDDAYPSTPRGKQCCLDEFFSSKTGLFEACRALVSPLLALLKAIIDVLSQ